MLTIHTIMSHIVNLRVHIAPVGFEIDRIALSARQMRADRVWLLMHADPTKDRAQSYMEKIKVQLKKEKIAVQVAYTDRFDLFKILKAVREIVEKEKGNDIFINCSSGSKIQAIACMMACMMFQGKTKLTPYYVEPESYASVKGEQLSSGLKTVVKLPAYEIHTPKPVLVQALSIINGHGGKITKKEMAKLADEKKLIIVNAKEENFQQARFASLDKNIIQPLLNEWKFIEVERIGRTRWIKMTAEGRGAVEFLR
ncbi:MAG: hypothetical protein E6K87_02005 [Thaumarchaeota archaeon]|nr:MAG: hypothetical protein AUI62_03625 [Thaumarchaeota archaeon 13_1_40CM_2_39_7]TLY04867.1 MAG: hypothetical protein E6K87_02005 [Nitrososphaerota archaeon]